MKILAIETSEQVCAVALAQDDILIKEEIIEDKNTHSVKLMPLVDKLLKQTNTSIKDIDLFACDIGPGSFTGIRIGISTIKAFIDVTNKKAVGVTSLEILAQNVNKDEIICSLIDAKNENIYYGLFEKNNDDIKLLDELKFDNINNVIQSLKNKNKKIIFVGSGSIAYKDMIESQLGNMAIIEENSNSKLNAKNIAKIAYKNKDRAVDTNDLKPLYLRPSSAERLKTDK